ncbi:ANTAR domain-containing protein [Nocardia sp. BMG111209]|uniref:ANTAR domain-containing protein n=1 Tax=Nocardia sp. BMG111209 TaxID=1160137 RepID=UPI000370EB0F|nr:ANTAR domain-containing protein [Nocardia sp. BMG111209]
MLDAMVEHQRQVTAAAQVRSALRSGSPIERAVGVVMAQRHCDRATALGVLHEISGRRGVGFTVVAVEIAATAG